MANIAHIGFLSKDDSNIVNRQTNRRLYHDGEDLIGVIDYLNSRLPDSLIGDGLIFHIYFDGNTVAICFDEIPLWNSEYDERPYGDENDCYAISVQDHVIQQLNRILGLLNSVNW